MLISQQKLKVKKWKLNDVMYDFNVPDQKWLHQQLPAT